ncbi:S-layer protein [Levilactobacillus angrenensis]|uniref:S-layer protein n=1 Tax=Levilactobacillus angrenensis TaxID=2486020 RepID=A0ABW1U9V2_9LACO|nr:S-layer protein [Levilactobacillus angrenensis]
MQSQLAKSLYLGLAALSLGAVATVTTTATSADASSKAKIVSKSALGKNSKNVEVTGTNAIYTKPGTVRGAKLVASKKTVKKLANSNHSKDYFRAYHMAVTNKGTVYYKIVSMNGKYRGYIYGGKVKGTIGAGIKEAQTVKEATMPSRTAGFHIKNVKKNTLWTAPQHTTYKAHKVNMYGTTKEDTFTVSKAETKTKEGSLYYYVTSDKNSDVSGWIFAGKGYNAGATTQELGGLSMTMAEAEATNNNSVKIMYRDGSKQVGEATWINSAAGTKAGDKVNTTATKATDAKTEPKNVAGLTLKDFISKNVPSGFSIDSATVATLADGATYGNNVYADVNAAATSKIKMVLTTVNANGKVVSGALTGNTQLTTADLAIALDKDTVSALTGKQGMQIGDSLTTIEKGLNSAVSDNGINGIKTYTDNMGTQYHYKFKFEKGSFNGNNKTAFYGDVLKANFTAELVEGAVNEKAPIVDVFA